MSASLDRKGSPEPFVHPDAQPTSRGSGFVESSGFNGSLGSMCSLLLLIFSIAAFQGGGESIWYSVIGGGLLAGSLFLAWRFVLRPENHGDIGKLYHRDNA